MIGDRMKILRGNRTQEDIANLIGVSRSRYSHYENGRSEPDLAMLEKLADSYQVSIDYLLGRTNSTKVEIDMVAGGHEDNFTPEEEFEGFANDPELERWYKELPKNKEEDLQSLIQMWDIIKKNKK